MENPSQMGGLLWTKIGPLCIVTKKNKKIITAYSIYDLSAEHVNSAGLIPEPGSPKREWMDDTRLKFAYKCLPLSIANAHGWDFLCPVDIEFFWSGGAEQKDLYIRHLAPDGVKVANSHFGGGVLTFNFPYLFRTPPGYALKVQGPPNNPKRGVTALEGIVETDWLPATFTMNWKVTEPYHTIKFEKGEPICRIMPMKFPDIEDWEFENPSLESNPELKESYLKWKEKRGKLLTELKGGGGKPAQYNDHDYIKGTVGGVEGERHRSALKLNTFEFGKVLDDE